MADLYLTPAERYTAALGGFYYGDLPEPGTVYTQLIKDILNGTTPEKEPKNILARFIYSLYISDLGDPYPRYELAKLLYWKLHDITPTKSGSILTVTIDGEEDYMTINTDLSRLWYKVLFGSKTDVITEFPYIFNTMQNKLSDWELFGNVEVSGTPTPDNPIMPEGCGERTGNLFDKSTAVVGYGVDNNSGSLFRSAALSASDYINISGESYIRATYITSGVANQYGAFYDENKTYISGYSGYSNAIAVPQNAVYTRITARTEYIDEFMLNLGSTALPYEPYGYKIPISSAGTTTPVYLGEVETTRKIGKIDLSELSWRMIIHGLWATTDIPNIKYVPVNTELGDGIAEKYTIHTGSGMSTALNCIAIDVSQVSVNTGSTSKKPTGMFWYVLAESETGIVNKPLMKIGEYADSLSRAQTGIDIPTVIGQNTLDVLTTVKPSSMRIEYTSADETRSRSKRISLLKSPLKKGLIK